MGMHTKRLLFLIHRWLGVVLCAFFAMWFVSGVVMMYVGYPKLTAAERLQHLPELASDAALLAPQQALARAGVTGPLKELRLAAASAGRPAYFAVPLGAARAKGVKAAPGSGTVVVDAVSGKRIAPVDEVQVMASATAYTGPGVALHYLGTIEEDAFTHSRGLDAHRPLHRVQLDDTDATLLYVSGRTAEVVRDASRTERIWNYAGAWIHWLYPFRGNIFDRYWTDIVNWLSIAGIVAALSGTIVGIQRWRFTRTYRSGSRSPYQGIMRWHHIGGLLFALIAITWIFSGLMSMNPWRIFDSGAAPLKMEALEGGPLQLTGLDAAPAALLSSAGGGIRELRWSRSLGKTVVLAHAAAGQPLLLDSQNAQPFTIDTAALREAATRLMPQPVQSSEILSAYDLYYYSRDAHTMTGGASKPLPVWRIAFADAQESWVYIDPHTGTVVARSDRGKRWSRWLFAMLHSWDWLPLLERRPLWDMVLIVLSLGGALLSVTGVVIGWRRLGIKLRSVRA
ncbi:PepSY-associated TM helix domain-containing protein [Massilia sp. BJB1822]|uniref:PepSY domain-containing protein n=1 Tax=Massilia sp. BJB1822 TaxID=2744470 RepID=UPI001594E638|nr:PepSY domain-containing protein [Massilia sp. BJB1822]